MARVGLVVPALDEERALSLVLADLPVGEVDVLVVVDNGSRDRTAEVARACGAFVVSEPRRGYGSACLAGLGALFGEHPDPAQRVPAPLGRDDIVVFLDADRSDHPEELSLLLAPIRAGRADLVIGSRTLGGASLRAMLPQAWFGNRLACVLMRLCFGLHATDLGPFRAIRAGPLRDLGMVDRDFGWTVEMQLKAHVAGLRTCEVPVRYRPRIGESKITGTLSGTLRASWKILSWILGWRLRLRSPRR
ncbi:MAG TPA: glycosyltransferase family 2 protein [Planctomycetota bacterium]|nr:glycosyltransferase family 2 protein [Planctomycetota bacterium]